MAPAIALALIQGAIGGAQALGGAIQRKRAEQAARGQIGKLGPDKGILDYRAETFKRYAALRGKESMLQKQYERQAEKNLASTLRGYREAGDIQAGGASALRAANEGALKAAGLGEQLTGQALGQLGTATQMAAPEIRRPEELKFQMELQKGAGGAQTGAAGISNIFNALQTYGMQKMYENAYGGGATGRQYPRGYVQGVNTGMLNLFPSPSTQTSLPSRAASGLIPRATPSGVMRRSYVPYVSPASSYPGTIYPFPTYPF